MGFFMKGLTLVGLLVFTYQLTYASAPSCVDAIKNVVNNTRNRIGDINRANKTNSTMAWNEGVFRDCVTWLEDRRNYRDSCQSSSNEWKAILRYLRQNTRAQLSQACNRSGCRCPDPIATISSGGLPLFLQKVKEMNAQQTDFSPPSPEGNIPQPVEI